MQGGSDSSLPEQQLQQQSEATGGSSSSSSTATEAAGGNPVISGADAQLQVSKEVIETLRNRVFGFDTMWVTSVDNYQQDGVVFKGNVRAKDPKVAYDRLKQRLQVSALGLRGYGMLLCSTALVFKTGPNLQNLHAHHLGLHVNHVQLALQSSYI